VCFQDFVKQADSLVQDEKFRQTIKNNAKEFIETNYSETREHREFEKLANSMSRTCIAKTEVKDDDAADVMEGHRVRFRFDDAKSKVAVRAKATPNKSFEDGSQSSPSQPEEQNQNVEKETSNGELENNVADATQSTSKGKKKCCFVGINVTQPEDGEEENPETSQVPSNLDFTGEEDKQPTEAECGEDQDHSSPTADPVKQASKKLLAMTGSSSSVASARSPSRGRKHSGSAKTDARKKATGTGSRPNSRPNSPPGTPSKKNTPKKTALKSSNSSDKAFLKQPSFHASASRAFSDSAAYSTKTTKK